MKLYLGAFLTFLYNDFLAHVPVHFIRLGFLRLFNKKVAKSAVILMHTRFLGFWNIEIGARVVINQYCLLDTRRVHIIIENDTDIGPYTKIWTTGHNPDSNLHELYTGSVYIKDHVWIASNVTILPNVTIERGAVVGASSTVHKNVGEKQIMTGVPAKFIRYRENDLTYELKYTPLWE